jgi:hypothetical protein
MRRRFLFIFALAVHAQPSPELIGTIKIRHTMIWNNTLSYPLCFQQNLVHLYQTNSTHLNLMFKYEDMRDSDCLDAYIFAATEESYIDYISEEPGVMNMDWTDVKDIEKYGIKVFHLN